MPRPVVVYTSAPRLTNIRGTLRAMFAGLRQARYAAYRLFLKKLRTDYSRSVLGVLWEFGEPLVVGLIFYALMRARVVAVGDIAIPYPVFLVYGLFLYGTFSDSLGVSLRTVRDSASALGQLNLSAESLILASFFRVFFLAAFRIPVMLLFSLVFGAFSAIGFAKFLLLFPAIVLPGFAVGLLLAPLNAVYNDVERAARIATRLLLYASPVLYLVPPMEPFRQIGALNPVGSAISTLRSLATQNIAADLPATLAWVALTLALGLVASMVFHVSVPVLSERASV